VVVLDGLGIGELPDAADYGDCGSNTLGNLAKRIPLHVPTLRALGLRRLADIGGIAPIPGLAATGKMTETSPGKDSVTGHWEMMGLPLARGFPLFPGGFPVELLEELSRRTGRGMLGNLAASGTQIIEDLGPEHLRSGALIVYTSADSVFQIAAHEQVVPLPELYHICDVAYELACEGLGVGRVIARPFVGTAGSFKRTSNRRDYALPPPGETVLDRLARAKVPVVAIGKIEDLFAGRGITRAFHTASDADGMDRLEQQMTEVDRGFIFTNLVDFDTLYGHRNDPEGYARNLEAFDRRLAALLALLRNDDLLVLTADHGNDPTTASTDHAREYVPLLVVGAHVRAGTDLGTRSTFADVGQTLAEIFDVGPLPHGSSFFREIIDAEHKSREDR
jgi:phosphopentomutase